MSARAPQAPWSWGVAPLPEQVRLAGLLREVTSLMLVQEQAGPGLVDAIAALETVRDSLARSVPADRRPRVGAHAGSDGRVYLDHCAAIHAFNPMFPAYEIEVLGPDRAVGTVTFPVAYEGPADGVNGGELGVFFDAVVQPHTCAVGQSGATRDLAIRYRRQTPLEVPLRFEIDRSVHGNTVDSTVRVLDGDRLLCSATTGAVTFDHADVPAISPRRVS